MIAISGVLVLVAIGLLVTGLVLPNLWFVYASIVVSLASAVCLVVGVFIGRGQAPTPRTASAKGARSKASDGPSGSAKKKTTGNRPSGRRSAKAGAGGARGKSAATATKDPALDEAEVVVVPGRLRYHLPTCRQVTGRDSAELELAEARSQGYVACTSCRPDSVLAARAEPDTADGDAEEAATETTEPAEEPAEESAEVDDTDASSDSDTVTVTVVTGQRRYHLASCQVIKDAAEDDAETEELPLAEARADGLTPCRVCAAPTEDS